eukprot:CAMPEP_0119101310 /NCGR_PEP_ID=MMETSP1180-20130426/401_1 /TAXON_ID=3052 ORGANISM="Chlamydomonas cf sp, Strain CCMP681" /NCGR_SAMPLE_ID=MMETSP1180 /ASSEMBLY_ACC=CAM_ASM_000741 /LENGTH=40 /DNA_ID= /DNA_START= /DNA_END= /DNA_ORIENTATION=
MARSVMAIGISTKRALRQGCACLGPDILALRKSNWGAQPR